MADSSTPVAAYPLLSIPIGLLEAHARQTRKEFDAAELDGLAASIKARGVVQPIAVKSLADGRYEILAGERRWRASVLAGLGEIPAVVRDDLSDQDIDVLHLVENLQRVDLTLKEECEGVRLLVNDVGVAKAAIELGKSEGWVSKRAGVLDMPAPLQDLVGYGQVKDLEIVNTLAQIQKIDPGRANRLVKTIVQPNAWDHPVTRDNVRGELQRAREAQERAKQQAQEVADAAKAPKAKPALDAAEMQAKERERSISRVKEARKKLRLAALDDMRTSLGFTEKQMSGFNAPVRLSYVEGDFPGSGSAGDQKFPKSTDACNFEFRGQGSVAILNRIASGFTKQPKIHVVVPQLTLEQAARLEAALHDVKDVSLWFEAKVSGKELGGICSRLTSQRQAPAPKKGPKPVTTPEKQGELCIGSFLLERVDRSDATAEIKAADLYAEYAQWCRSNKADAVALNDNRWGDSIAAAGIQKVRRKTGYHYLGCALSALV